VAVAVDMPSRAFWSNVTALPTLWRVKAPSIRSTVLPAGFGTGLGVVVATTLVGAV
jgi:hypothetical protein